MTNLWNAGSHAVQFYDQEAFVHHAIAEFLTRDTGAGDRLILISRLHTFSAVAGQIATGQYGRTLNADEHIQFVDAEAALSQMMHGDALDQPRAERLFRDLLSQSRPHCAHGTIRLYGEVVDILCQHGRRATALQFEGLATVLLDLEPQLSILCGYALERFNDDANAAQLHAVCQKHTHVIAAESFGTAPRTHGYQACMLEYNAFNHVLAGQSPPTGDSTTPARNVYVIDDDATLRRALGRLLTSSNWPVQMFDSAEAFLAEHDKLSSGCLVIDIQLQGMNGLDLIRRLTHEGLSWPIIVMSALSEKATENEALRLGARAFLRKPFNSQDLLDEIARAFF